MIPALLLHLPPTAGNGVLTGLAVRSASTEAGKRRIVRIRIDAKTGRRLGTKMLATLPAEQYGYPLRLFPHLPSGQVALLDPDAPDEPVRILRLSDGRIRSLSGTAGAHSAEWSPDGRRLALGFGREKPKVRVLGASSGKTLLQAEGIACVRFAPKRDELIGVRQPSLRDVSFVRLEASGMRPASSAEVDRAVGLAWREAVLLHGTKEEDSPPQRTPMLAETVAPHGGAALVWLGSTDSYYREDELGPPTDASFVHGISHYRLLSKTSEPVVFAARTLYLKPLGWAVDGKTLFARRTEAYAERDEFVSIDIPSGRLRILGEWDSSLEILFLHG